MVNNDLITMGVIGVLGVVVYEWYVNNQVETLVLSQLLPPLILVQLVRLNVPVNPNVLTGSNCVSGYAYSNVNGVEYLTPNYTNGLCPNSSVIPSGVSAGIVYAPSNYGFSGLEGFQGNIRNPLGLPSYFA